MEYFILTIQNNPYTGRQNEILGLLKADRCTFQYGKPRHNVISEFLMRLFDTGVNTSYITEPSLNSFGENVGEIKAYTGCWDNEDAERKHEIYLNFTEIVLI